MCRCAHLLLLLQMCPPLVAPADVRNRLSVPFRQVPVDPVPLGGVRASPSGRYLLLLFRWAGSRSAHLPHSHP